MRFSISKLFNWSFVRAAGRWVHPSVEAADDAFEEHSRFISSQAIMGSIAVLAAPAYLAINGSISGLAAGLFSAFTLPLFWSYLVSKTGRLDWGIKGLLVSVALIIITLSLLTGGAGSNFLPLLFILPLEAAIRSGRSGAYFGIFLAVAAGFGVVAAPSMVSAELTTFIPDSSGIPALIAAIYTISIALRIGAFEARSNARLVVEKNRFRLLADNATDLITRHDANGATLFASPAARPLFGTPASGLLKSGMFEKIHLQDRIIFLKSLSNAAHDGKSQSCQFRIRCKGSGDRVWKQVEMRCRPAKDPITGQIEVVSVTRDITEAKEKEAIIKQAAENAEEANLAQRRFLTTMSHELKTPLNAILGFSDILKQEIFGKLPHERHHEYVGLIHESGEHLLNVVDDLLDISRIEAGRYELSLETFAAIDIADATIKMLQPMAAKAEVIVLCDVLPTLPELNADRRSCQQILINLVSNAIKFSPKGGTVRVSAHQHGRSLKLRVKDTGIGIEENFLSTIGQSFMQGDHGHDREYEGSGLGLSVVKGLVALHNGEFDIKSTVGKGTTVTITLPLKAQIAKPVPANEEAQLVHLNAISPRKSKSKIQSSKSLKKGDSHVRISA